METSNFFNLKRLYLLLRRQLISNSKSLLIAFGGVAGTLLVISLLVAYFEPQATAGLITGYIVVLFIGGYIFSSNIFNELHQYQKSYAFLTLPVSTTERLAGAWLLTGILYPVVAVLSIGLIVFLANLIMHLNFDLAPFRSIFSENHITALKVYVVTQSLFLLGAAYFRKNNFLKTLLAVFVFLSIINIYSSLLGWALFNNFFTDGIVSDGQVMAPGMEKLFTKQIPAVAKFAFWYLTIPFFLISSWFAIKEREV